MLSPSPLPLSPDQTTTLRALVNRIIPADDYPAGWEGGVEDYLARQFERDLKPLLPVYRLGLDALDAEAHTVYWHAFDNLPEAVQDDLLARIEIGTVTTVWAVDPGSFFRMLVEHCAEGYYSDPGNVSWDMIGFKVNG